MKMFKRKSKRTVQEFDRENLKPVLRCSICTGEQVAGFQNVHTGKFQEVMLIRNASDLQEFLDSYGLQDIEKIY